MIDLAERLHITPEQIATFCKRHHIVRLSCFGSVVRDDFCPESDIDVLVKFEDKLPPTFSAIDLVHIKDALSKLFGREVDLIEEGAILNPYRLRNIMASRRIVYDAA